MTDRFLVPRPSALAQPALEEVGAASTAPANAQASVERPDLEEEEKSDEL